MLKDLKIAAYLAYKTVVKGRKATNALMIFIMSLAFVNLVFISSILGGVVAAIHRQVQVNYVSNIVVEPQDEPVKKTYIIRADELASQISQLPGVAGVSNHYRLNASIAFDQDKDGSFLRKGASITGVNPETESGFSEIAADIVSGRYLKPGDTDSIIFGVDLAGQPGDADSAEGLGGVAVGDKVDVTYGNGVKREYAVQGVFKTNFALVDHSAFISRKEAESVLGVYGQASQILVKLKHPGDEDKVMPLVRQLAPNLSVHPWTDYSGLFDGVSTTVSTITTVISAIGLAVAAITIFILIFVNVTYKRRQIGILKAIGIRQEIVVYSYVMQALFYSVFGVLFGSMAVFLILVPYFTAHPLDLPVGTVGMAVEPSQLLNNILMLIGAALVAGWIPSWQGAREHILDAIWGR